MGLSGTEARRNRLAELSGWHGELHDRCVDETQANSPNVWTLGLAGRAPEALVGAFSAVPGATVVDARFNPNWPLPRNPSALAKLAAQAGLGYEAHRGLGNRLHKIGGYELAAPEELYSLQQRISVGERLILVCQCRCADECIKIAADGREICDVVCRDRCRCERKCHRYVLIVDELRRRLPGLAVFDL